MSKSTTTNQRATTTDVNNKETGLRRRQQNRTNIVITLYQCRRGSWSRQDTLPKNIFNSFSSLPTFSTFPACRSQYLTSETWMPCETVDTFHFVNDRRYICINLKPVDWNHGGMYVVHLTLDPFWILEVDIF